MNKIPFEFRERYGEILLINKYQPEPRAQFAMKLLEHFAIVAGETEGEDTAGRSKARLQSVEEAVTRAINIADLAFDEFDKHGWLIDIPEAKLKAVKNE